MSGFYKYLSSFLLIGCLVSFSFSQEIIISGQITSCKTKAELDSSLVVVVNYLNKAGDSKTKKAYTNSTGTYKAILSKDSVSYKELRVSVFQDKAKVINFSTGAPCPVDCPASPLYLSISKARKIKINLDSSLSYTQDFCMTEWVQDIKLPVFYFDKNSSEIAESDAEEPVDSILCKARNQLICHGNFVVEVSGRASSEENDKENLSLKRAEKIRDKLIALGVDSQRLVVKAGGDIFQQNLLKDHPDDYETKELKAKLSDEVKSVVFIVLRKDFRK